MQHHIRTEGRPGEILHHNQQLSLWISRQYNQLVCLRRSQQTSQQDSLSRLLHHNQQLSLWISRHYNQLVCLRRSQQTSLQDSLRRLLHHNHNNNNISDYMLHKR